MITTVLLDLDDTILQDSPATLMAFQTTAEHAASVSGVNPEDLITSVRDHSDQLWAHGPFPDWLDGIGTGPREGLRARFQGEDHHWATMREWGPTFRRQSWMKALESLGIEDATLAAELDTMFERERAITNPWCPGGEEALKQLAASYRLGMVTNGIPDVQRTKINNTGIEQYFDAIVISGEIAIGKPEPAIYQHALDLLGAKPEETIMVGDSFPRDVMGSQAFGLRGVWISMGRPKPEGGDPWLTIESLAELPALLEEHHRSLGSR